MIGGMFHFHGAVDNQRVMHSEFRYSGIVLRGTRSLVRNIDTRGVLINTGN